MAVNAVAMVASVAADAAVKIDNNKKKESPTQFSGLAFYAGRFFVRFA